MAQTIAEKFHARWMPVTESGCWLWTGSLSPYGYGMFSFHGKTRRAHRVSYELFKGPIPAHLQIDHQCRVRCCVNPYHLEVVSCALNIARVHNPYATEATEGGMFGRMEIRLESNIKNKLERDAKRARMSVSHYLRFLIERGEYE